MISLTATEYLPSFDHPIEMLHACHGRILSQCDTLRKLTIYLTNHGCDQQVQQAATNILRYFDTAGQFHHQDEEQDLFPALRISSANADKSYLDSLLVRLLKEHAEMFNAWIKLRPELFLLSQGVPVTLADSLTENFINRYTAHIAAEEDELLPLSMKLLDTQQMIKIGMHMAQRRGAKFDFGN
jgi:hemerythrin-like domain-containing protein